MQKCLVGLALFLVGALLISGMFWLLTPSAPALTGAEGVKANWDERNEKDYRETVDTHRARMAELLTEATQWKRVRDEATTEDERESASALMRSALQRIDALDSRKQEAEAALNRIAERKGVK